MKPENEFATAGLSLTALALAGLGCGDDDSGGDVPGDVADADGGADADADMDGAPDEGPDAEVLPDGEPDMDAMPDGEPDMDGMPDGEPDAMEEAEAAGPPWDLTFSGSGFSPHEGQDLGAALVETGSGSIVSSGEMVVTGGSFSFVWMDALQEGMSYRIDYYADFNSNGVCDAPPTDHVWSEPVPAFTGDTVVSVGHTTDFVPAACGSF
jgi:hypothetical protein